MTIRAELTTLRATRDAQRWHERHTIGADALPRLDEVPGLKRASGVRVSVVVPVPATGDVAGIERLAEDVLERHALADEVLVVTRGRLGQISRLDPVDVSTLIEEVPATAGRGEALWRSLSRVDGDVVVWLDPARARASTVAALVGALLRREDLRYVTGASGDAAERAIAALLARPMLAMLFPELGGFVSPPARAIAGRRDLLERIPFLTDEGVETAMLIDAFHVCGLQEMGQVVLDDEDEGPAGEALPTERAYAIAQAILQRAEEAGRLRAAIDYPSHPLLVLDGAHLEGAMPQRVERPPIEMVPTYLDALRNQDAIAASR